ncbi:hypothetical protein RND81_09G033300 [Saponaria officinalis]|uniref:Reverse transcriptase domain-containing protein n=1 Tax=Saponaria officinalis TaxID=3572 RepID=A0AAW1II24_SAPOF
MVTHLFFADDSILFLKAKEREAICIREVLHEYEQASGQRINFDKTTVSFSKGTRADRKRLIENILHVRTVEVQERYLGLPTVVGHSKKIISSVIRDKLSKKLQNWRGELSSKAGKEILIKAIVQSIPTYAMSIFKLPSNFCDELRSFVTKFWWGSKNGKKKIPWLPWHKLCQPKCRGGLGFRDFNKFNMALLGKQAWRLVTENEGLMSRIMKSRYFPDSSFMEAGLGSNPSNTWRGIWEARDVLQLGLRRRIGNGLSTRVWHDPWIPATQSRRVISSRNEAREDMLVAELFEENGTGWCTEQIRHIFLPFEQERIMNIRLSLSRPEDSWCWELEKMESTL